MKLEQIVALAVRLFAIVVAIYAIRNGVSMSSFFYNQGWSGESYIYAGVMASLIVISIGLWKFPLTVARGLVKFREDKEADETSINAEQIQVVGFTILGLYLLFGVISDLVYWGVIWFVAQRNTDIPIEINLDQKALMVSTFFELVFVLFLLLGASMISKILQRARYGVKS